MTEKTLKKIHIPEIKEYTDDEMQLKSLNFYKSLSNRRSIRDFSNKPIERKIIENCIRAAGTAPSGANIQPWHFALVFDPEIKKKIRLAAEKEEKEFYNNRAPKEWLEVLAPLGTDDHKPYLEIAPYLIVIFMEKFGKTKHNKKVKHYYGLESVGIATGILITALHNAGLATLTHTPSPMGFLNKILKRPENERPFLILVVGHPAEDAKVPDINRKPINTILTKY
jgi:nitroreductase